LQKSFEAGAALHNGKYRPDIDGLRAIAVSLVVVCHAWPKILPGGFIGVDIFFVISGYLISLILIRDFDADSFSIRNFYNRRIRRIFPALVTVLTFVLLFGWFCLFKREFQTLGQHVGAATLFSENFLLWGEASYFDAASELKPTLHLWSLAIEEQFYILWPILLFAAHRFRLNAVIVIACLAVVSFGVNLYDIGAAPTAAYYSPIGRAWELMVGSLLAYGEVKHPNIMNRYKSIQSGIGIGLIAVALVLITPKTDFPGFAALAPAIGAGLLISGGPDAWINRRILSLQPMVWCGLISYPLYLWHWPLLSFAHIIFGDTPPAVAGACVVSAIVAAGLTFWFIERPLRTYRAKKNTTVFLVVSMTAVAAAAALIFVPVIAPRLKLFDAPEGNEWSLLMTKTDHFDPDGVGIYHLERDRPETILFIGDSHLAQYAARIDKVITSTSASPGAVMVVGGGCIPIVGVTIPDRGRTKCWKQTETAFEMAKDARYSTVVIGGAWNYYFLRQDYMYHDGERLIPVGTLAGKKAALDRLGGQIRELIRAGKHVFVVLDSPESNRFDPAGKAIRLSLSDHNFLPSSTVDIAAEQLTLKQELRAWAEAEGATVIDPYDTVCAQSRCYVTSSTGRPLYRDKSHFNPAWSVDGATFIDAAITPGG
jgi:peptidoglycan/LPS O-acetylase OafA/YrhL